MEWFSVVANLFLHLDARLAWAVAHYGAWTYALLFTWKVTTRFLPYWQT